MNRVIVTKAMVGIAGMQVCAVKDASDVEILDVCNRENPSGTTNGWAIVVRDDKEHPQCNPIPCAQEKERVHFMVMC